MTKFGSGCQSHTVLFVLLCICNYAEAKCLLGCIEFFLCVWGMGTHNPFGRLLKVHVRDPFREVG